MQVLLDTQREMLDAGCPKRLKRDQTEAEAIPFYYSGTLVADFMSIFKYKNNSGLLYIE